MKKPNGPVDGDKGDRQQWVVDNREPADFPDLWRLSYIMSSTRGGLSNLATKALIS